MQERERLDSYLDNRDSVCIVLVFCVAMLSCVFIDSYRRIYDSVKDLGLSFGYYFLSLLYINPAFSVSVNDIPSYVGHISLPSLPASGDLFGLRMGMYWHSLWNLQTLAKFFASVMNVFGSFLRWLVVLFPLIVVVWLLYRSMFQENSLAHGSESKRLAGWKKFRSDVAVPVWNRICSLWSYVGEHKIFAYVCIFFFCIYFNVFTIFIEFFAYYFYFVSSFDLKNIYVQFYKLFLDLRVPFRSIPWPFWIFFALYLFNSFRKKVGYEMLSHHESMDRGFINSMGQATFIVGTPGTGKTTCLTDMALSQEVMFRDKALELLLKQDAMFPNFPWIRLEDELKRCFADHTVFNLATCGEFAQLRTANFLSGDDSALFGYDWQSYGLDFNDGSKIVRLVSESDSVSSVLEIYCKLYFIYVFQSSLLVSNYGIREDNVLKDLGNFPIWHSDFFRSDPRLMDVYSRNSHILDFDSLRLGKKLVENNMKSNSFEFGVLVITEIGKERGNQLENQEVKKSDPLANTKNDQFNSFLKMVRHSATVDNFPFVKVLFDDQRPESLGADARELCEKIIYIREKSDPKVPIMLFRLESIFYDFVSSHFHNFYIKYRYVRGDKNMFVHIAKSLYSAYSKYYMKIFNVFSYSELSIDMESNKLDGQFDSSKYFLSYKKIYSNRFATDSFSDYFAQKAMLSPIGIDDLDEFKCYRATLAELSSENSYFITGLLSGEVSDSAAVSAVPG